jgi:hypothetical protein
MKKRSADAPLATDAATAKTSKQRTIDALTAASPSVLLRDGELVLYRRTRSLLYQCRFKLADGKWHRFSTRKASLENAIAAACDMYDEARYRQRLGLAHRTHTFAQIASITLAEMRQLFDDNYLGRRVRIVDVKQHSHIHGRIPVSWFKEYRRDCVSRG